MTKHSLKRPAVQLPDGTIQIPLTRGQVAIIDAVDADLVDFNWRAQVGRNTFYPVRREGKHPNLLLGRIILARALGREILPSEMCGHWDNNGCNNVRSNLYLTTRAQSVAQNAANNKKKINRKFSGIRGVIWDTANKKWAVDVRINGKQKHLGLFATLEAAYEAYYDASDETAVSSW